MDARAVKDCLRARHPSPEWVWAEEFSLAPGYSTAYGDGRRIDGLAFNCYPSRGHLIIGYEVKVSRGDFLAEIKRPEKRKTAVDMVDEFYFATPRGLVHSKEIPPDCGLIECYEGPEKRSRLKVRVKNHENKPYESEETKINKLHPRWFMASVMRQFDPERVRKEKDLEIRSLKHEWRRFVNEVDWNTRKSFSI